MNYEIILDLCLNLKDANDIKAFHEEMDIFGLSWSIHNAVGPAGGWPEIKLVGTHNCIMDYLLANEMDDEIFTDSIKEA